MCHENNTITSIDGLLVGNAEDRRFLSGCTIVLFEDEKATMSYVSSGGWPGSYDTEVIRQGKTFVEKQAILLTGGDVLGFDAVIGIRKYLIEKGIASPHEVGKVPNIAGTNIYDIKFCSVENVNYPDLGYRACTAASRSAVAQGNVGAGIGATVGKFNGLESAMKGGLGTHVINLPRGISVGALVVVNAVGNVFDLTTGKTVAGMRNLKKGGFVEFEDYVAEHMTGAGKGTTIGVVATNVVMSHEELLKVAEMADDGLARSIRPVHMTHDGDTIFTLSTGRCSRPKDVSQHYLVDLVGHHASEAVRISILNAVRHAETLNGLIGLASGS